MESELRKHFVAQKEEFQFYLEVRETLREFKASVMAALCTLKNNSEG